jgi:hypothetical protein
MSASSRNRRRSSEASNAGISAIAEPTKKNVPHECV